MYWIGVILLSLRCLTLEGTMKVKVSGLQGVALDWAVAHCEGLPIGIGQYSEYYEILDFLLSAIEGQEEEE
jgi:hypothetical protein